MKGKHYADVDAIQKVSTAITKDDLKKSFDNLLDRANRCPGTFELHLSFFKSL